MNRPTGRWLVERGAVLLFSAAPAALCAQLSPTSTSATLDVAGAQLHYDDYLPSTLVTLAPTLRLDLPSAVVSARGSVSRFESGHLNSQGELAASRFTSGRRALRGELAGDATLGHHQTIGSTGRAQIAGRLHLASADHGIWVGGGWGWSALGGGLGATVAQQEGGAWARVGPLRATAAVRGTQVAGMQYADAELAARWSAGRIDAGVEAGVRGGDRLAGSGRERHWASADAALWLHPRLAVVAAAGRFLPDPTTSAIGGRFASLGLRAALRRQPADELPRILLPRTLDSARDAAAAGSPAIGAGGVGDSAKPDGALGASGAVAGAGSLAVEETGDGRVVLRFDLPGATSAELMGDLTDWQPVSLQRAPDGRWSITFAPGPGVHRLNLRTDGGAWRAPPGLTAVDDGFGGRVGLLVVRR